MIRKSISIRLYFRRKRYEMDFSDGEVRFRTRMALCDGELTAEMVEAAVLPALATSEFYHDTVMRVALGEVEPAVAIGGAEKATKAEGRHGADEPGDPAAALAVQGQ